MNGSLAQGAARDGSDSERVFDVGAIAFDLDGTLLDTIHDLAPSVEALLAELGHAAIGKDTVRDMVGRGLADLVRRVLARARDVAPEAVPAADVADALARYEVHYAAQLGRETQAFPGMAEGLALLAAEGIPLAVITNKASRFVRPHLRAAGIETLFSIVVGGDDLPTKKPDPGPLLHVASKLGVPAERLLMVGDSINDVRAARAAGCPVVVVPYGYNEGEPVQNLAADGIVPTLLALAERIRYRPAALR